MSLNFAMECCGRGVLPGAGVEKKGIGETGGLCASRCLVSANAGRQTLSPFQARRAPCTRRGPIRENPRQCAVRCTVSAGAE